MDVERLSEFLVESNRAGYAGGEGREWVKEPDGSTTIHFENGAWHSHDNFFGGEPYGGRTVVLYEGKPCWLMVYYGWVEAGVDKDLIYAILRNALMHMPDDHPFRGPKEYKEGEHAYLNHWQGEVGRFSGMERIVKEGKQLYQASYLGGLVDQSR